MKYFLVGWASPRVYASSLADGATHDNGRGEPIRSPSAKKNRIPSVGNAEPH